MIFSIVYLLISNQTIYYYIMDPQANKEKQNDQQFPFLQLLEKKTTFKQVIESMIDVTLQGRPSRIPKVALKFYIHNVMLLRSKLPNPNWLPSVKQFQRLVNGDPTLRMNWEFGISQSTNTLNGKTSQQVFEMIDTVCKSPPPFTHSILVGVPINAIFIQFMQTQNGRSFFAHQRVNMALKNVMNDYSKMLQSPESTKYLTKQPEVGWFSAEANEDIHNEWYKIDQNDQHYGFKNWNQWFLRQFKEGMRPLGDGTPQGVDLQDVIVNSCQSTTLTEPIQPQKNVKFTDNFWLKDNRYSLNDMFGGVKYNKQYLAEYFVGGTVYQAFLSALSYHRWHAPVDGVIQEVYSIDGTYYLDQSQFIGYDQGSPQKCESYLSAVAARMVIVIKPTNKKIGKIAIIYIGMAEVSTCVSHVKVGDHVKKGQQIGNFMFGGSSHLMVFSKKANLTFKSNFYQQKKVGQETVLVSQRQNVCSYLAHV